MWREILKSFGFLDGSKQGLNIGQKMKVYPKLSSTNSSVWSVAAPQPQTNTGTGMLLARQMANAETDRSSKNQRTGQVGSWSDAQTANGWSLVQTVSECRVGEVPRAPGLQLEQRHYHEPARPLLASDRADKHRPQPSRLPERDMGEKVPNPPPPTSNKMASRPRCRVPTSGVVGETEPKPALGCVGGGTRPRAEAQANGERTRRGGVDGTGGADSDVGR